MTLKLGKLPARKNAVTFKLSAYLDTSKLPTVPAVFGHQGLLGNNIGMLGNDQYGDCVWAGAGHETMLWTDLGGHPATFTDRSVLSDYARVTGFDPNDPSTDRGTDMEQAAKFRRKTGVIDHAGHRHQVAAYLAIDAGDVDSIATAAYLFGAVGIGIEFPGSAMDQFNAGEPWSVVKGAEVEGGHYVPIVGRLENGNLDAITWGRLQEVEPAFLEKYNDEVIVYLSHEFLTHGKSPEFLDADQLLADLRALG